jgi:hypothetical protein
VTPRDEDLPRIDFDMVKDGQLDRLKEFILASFQAGQQPRPHQVRHLELCAPRGL